MRLQKAYDAFKDRADFVWVYIREAHPSDGFRPARHVSIEQPGTFGRREEVAASCASHFKLTIPVLVDDMEDSVAKAYNAFPDRLFILSANGTIAYRGDRGPRGFKVDEMHAALAKLLADTPKDKDDLSQRSRDQGRLRRGPNLKR